MPARAVMWTGEVGAAAIMLIAAYYGGAPFINGVIDAGDAIARMAVELGAPRGALRDAGGGLVAGTAVLAIGVIVTISVTGVVSTRTALWAIVRVGVIRGLAFAIMVWLSDQHRDELADWLDVIRDSLIAMAGQSSIWGSAIRFSGIEYNLVLWALMTLVLLKFGLVFWFLSLPFRRRPAPEPAS